MSGLGGGPWANRNFKLTGRIRYRRGDERVGIFAREPVIIAMVEETYERYQFLIEGAAQKEIHWRDMRTSDLAFIARQSKDDAA